MQKATRFTRIAKVEAKTLGTLRDQKNIRLDATLACLDDSTQTELRKLLPGLLWASRAWHARFLTKGCLACRRKHVPYGSGGMCQSCVNANRDWIRKFIKVASANRDTVLEIGALSLKFDVAQRLLNGD